MKGTAKFGFVLRLAPVQASFRCPLGRADLRRRILWEIPYFFSEPDATALLDNRVARKWAPDYSRVVRLSWKHYRGLYPSNPEFSGLDAQPMVFANRLRMALCSEAGRFEGWPAFAEFIAERAIARRLSAYSQSPLRHVSFGLNDVLDWINLLRAEFAMLQASMSPLPLDEGPAAMLQYNLRHGRQDDLFWGWNLKDHYGSPLDWGLAIARLSKVAEIVSLRLAMAQYGRRLIPRVGKTDQKAPCVRPVAEAPRREVPEPLGALVLKRRVETCERAVGPEGPRPPEHASGGAAEVREAVEAAVGSYELTDSKEAAVGPDCPSRSDRGMNTEGVTPGTVSAAAAGSAVAAGYSAPRSVSPPPGRLYKGIKGSGGAVLQEADLTFQAELVMAKAASLVESETRPGPVQAHP